MNFLEKLYQYEYEYMHPVYKKEKKRYFSDVLYWTDYLVDKEKLDMEFPVVERDYKAVGKRFESDFTVSDYADFDLFFMMLRLRLIYDYEREYTRMKLRTLLKHYGYKRRSEAITSRIRDCLMFYHIQPYLKGEQECDIRDISLDDMITFRLL